MKYWLLVMLALGVTSTAQGQAGAAYYGVALGNFDYDEKDFRGNSFVTDKVSSYRLMVGYQFMEHLTVEGGYGTTGTIRDTATVSAFPAPGTVDLNISYEFRMLTVRLLGVLPFDNGVSLLGGLGYTDVKRKYALTDGISSVSGSEATNEPGYYVGAQYDWDRVAVRVGYEKFDFDSATDVSETMLTFFYKL